MNVGTMTAQLKKMFEDSDFGVKGFGGSIWGNNPPPRQTATLDRLPPETSVNVKLTVTQVHQILKAIEDGGYQGANGLIATLKQALVK